MPSHQSHDPGSCRLCESVGPYVRRRHWKHEPKAGAWHVIADGPELMARLPRRAHFATVLAYRLIDEVLHYTGPLYFEFDTDPASALTDLRRCVSVLEVEYGLPLDAIHAWHSGSRGFHVTIPPVMFGADEGHPQLPRVYAGMIERLFPPSVASTLDRSVYSRGKGRMWRLPNRRRDNGRYKVPLALREVFHKSCEELEALTTQVRHGNFWPSDDELSPCPELVVVYQETRALVERGSIIPSLIDESASIPQGRRNQTLTRMAGAMRRQGMSEASIHAALTVENRRCDPPLDDRELANIATSISRYHPAVTSTPADPACHAPGALLGGRYVAREVPHGR